MHERRWHLGGLFWRLTASYFLATLVAALIAEYVGRREWPFSALRDSPVVLFFDHIGNDTGNSGVLFVLVASSMGLLTGLLVSGNLTRRLRRITSAVQAWSRGEFTAVARMAGSDELGILALDLNHMAEQIQDLFTARQALAVVEERNRLARDLHDTVKQQVFANALLVRAARKLVARDPERAETYLREAEALADRTQQELVALIRALRPASIADKGLVKQLQEYAADWSRRIDIAIEVRAQGERTTSLDIEEAFYRVAEEALANVARHSEAQAVELRLSWSENRLGMVIRDNGKGFDVLRAADRGVGLASMRERIEAHGGTLDLNSSPNGTTIEVSVPLEASLYD